MDLSSIPFPSISLSSSYLSTDAEQVEFVTPDSKYECTACRNYLREPLQTTCGHRICRSCLEERLALSGGDGFMCLANEEECEVITHQKVHPDFSVVREMGLQLVYCVNHTLGCPVQVELKKLKDHIPQCNFVTVECPFAPNGCKETVPKEYLERHQLDCTFRPAECEHCGLLLPFCVLPDHVKNDCPQSVVACPFECDVTDLVRSQVEEHKPVCPRRPRDCKLKALGCNFQGTEEEVLQHEADSSKEHLDIAILYILGLDVENARLRASLEKVQSESVTLQNRIAELSQEVENLRQATSSMIVQMKQSEQTQLKMLASRGEEILKLEDRMRALEQHMQEMIIVKDKLVQQEKKLEALGTTGGHSSSIPDAMREQFVNHDRTIGVHDVRLAELSLRLQCMETTNYDGILIWKICEYQRRRRDARNGTTLSLYSQPFYTSRYGYKMCARVYLNGDGAGKGTHISFFFVVMQGDYDDILRWPFQQKVTLMLLDQRSNRRHVSDTFRPDPSSSSFMKPSSPMNVASGCPLFIAHSQLESDDTFLKNDTLFFKVAVDTSDLLNP